MEVVGLAQITLASAAALMGVRADADGTTRVNPVPRFWPEKSKGAVQQVATFPPH